MFLDFSVIFKFLLKSAHIGKMNTYNILVIKYNGTRLTGRYRHRWEHNIEMCFLSKKVCGCGLYAYGTCLGSVADYYKGCDKPLDI